MSKDERRGTILYGILKSAMHRSLTGTLESTL